MYVHEVYFLLILPTTGSGVFTYKLHINLIPKYIITGNICYIMLFWQL